MYFNKKKLPVVILTFFIFILTSGFTVVGHRGDPIKAPEETFQSFDTAFNEGADYVELDVHESSDGVLVVSHDINLERITGSNVNVNEQTFANIQKLTQQNGEPVHSLDEVFEHYQDNPNAKFLIETKKLKNNVPTDMEDNLKVSIDKYHMQDRVMFHSFYTKSLKKESEIMPDIPRIYIAKTLKKINFEILQYVTGVNLSSKIVTEDIVDELHGAGKSVYAWDEMNENAKKWNTLINKPIDGVVTNYPETGASYRDLKDLSKNQTLDKDYFYIGSTNKTIYENPYKFIKRKTKVEPLYGYHVTKSIKFGDKNYFQIGTNQFVESTGFNTADTTPQLLQYYGANIVYRGQNYDNRVFKKPGDRDSLINYLNWNSPEQVIGVQRIGTSIWLKIDQGWVNSDDVLVQLNSQKLNGNSTLDRYNTTDDSQKLTNIDLLQMNSFLYTEHKKSVKSTKIIKNVPNLYSVLFDNSGLDNSINDI
ncbi:glycerophosphodiester phosphodiesterase [Lactobacillus terrae]|uniref:glycerophosphodiester phosphodiesterase n=1 Tax=Lactobacillus terrae TaxID=2269374 RepID=UPI000C1B6C79|nr:glycerophosphodiester phosphodiesterase family protein [Lactobacillus terrae]